MRHSLNSFDSNRPYSFASETVDGSSPFLYMGSVLLGGLATIPALALYDFVFVNQWWTFLLIPLVAFAWFFAWFFMPRMHVHYGMTARQIDTYKYFVELPGEVQTAMGGKDKVIEVIKAADKTELLTMQRAITTLNEEWLARKKALARVAPERDQVAGYVERIKEITSQVQTERETYEEML